MTTTSQVEPHVAKRLSLRCGSIFVSILVSNQHAQSQLDHYLCRWWFQRFFMFIPIWKKKSILTNIFLMGWNHQLDYFYYTRISLGWRYLWGLCRYLQHHCVLVVCSQRTTCHALESNRRNSLERWWKVVQDPWPHGPWQAFPPHLWHRR